MLRWSLNTSEPVLSSGLGDALLKSMSEQLSGFSQMIERGETTAALVEIAHADILAVIEVVKAATNDSSFYAVSISGHVDLDTSIPKRTSIFIDTIDPEA